MCLSLQGDSVFFFLIIFFHMPLSLERSKEQQLKLAMIQHLAQGHFSVTAAGQVRSLNPQEPALRLSCLAFSCEKKLGWSYID